MKELKYSYNNPKTLKQFTDEVIERKIYEKFFEVQDNFTVVDIGAMVGAFPISIIEKEFKVCYLIEPDPINFNDLKTNLSDNYGRFIFINEAINSKSRLAHLTEHSGFGSIFREGTTLEPSGFNVFQNGTTPVLGRTLRDIFQLYKIDKIDFLKMDCEGGEYAIFKPENEDILTKIDFISGELHNESIDDNQNDIFNRENMIKVLDCIEKYYDVFYTSIDEFPIDNIRGHLDYFRQFLFYATNKKLKNWVEIKYEDGNARATGVKLESDVSVSFQELMTNDIVYSSILHPETWSMTTVKSNRWKVFIDTDKRSFNVTISEKQPLKYIKF